MLLNNYANLPPSYLGLALLYQVTGHPEASFKVLERLFILMPKIPGIESAQIYAEAHNLYSEIKSETEEPRKALINNRNSRKEKIPGPAPRSAINALLQSFI